MKKSYRTALGKMVDMDTLRLSNEETIAVGNMKVNARGDELGPGGQVIKSRNEVMDDYYRMHGGVVNSDPVTAVPETAAVQENRNNRTVRGSAAKKILEDQDGVA